MSASFHLVAQVGPTWWGGAPLDLPRLVVAGASGFLLAAGVGILLWRGITGPVDRPGGRYGRER